jgi:uncharacterized membrane protein
MNIARIIFLLAAIVLFIAQLTLVNFEDFSWHVNAGSYLGMLNALFIAGFAFVPKLKKALS